MTPSMIVHLLGPFETRDRNGKGVSVRSRRSRALLACLAVDQDKGWTRTRLATLLWGRSEQQGRSSLRQELVQLRKDLGVTAPADWGDDTVIRLPLEIATDIARFRDAIGRQDAPLAASLWRGELLEGMAPLGGPFADWLALSRTKLRKQASECFARALRELGDSDDPLPFEIVAQKLVMLDASSEDGYRCLIRCAAVRRDVAAAIDRYRDYAASLGAGRDASPAMQRLRDEAIAMMATRVDAVGSADPASWIREIDHQHHAAAPPQPQTLSLVEGAASLAIVPFLDLSPGAASRTAFADGMTEEMTTAMAHIPGLFVTAHQSCMVYKNSPLDARTIARELGVRYLVEGGVEIHGKMVRVNARLVDGQSGFHLWANNFDGQLEHFFAVRDRIVTAILAQIQPALTVAEINRALEAGPAKLDAWTRLQRAHAHVLFNRGAQTLSGAVAELNQALAIDPDYAMAQALLAAVYTWRSLWSTSPRTARERTLALDFSERARRNDPKNAFVLINCADTVFYSAGDIDLARELLSQAVTRNPYDPQGLVLLANVNRTIDATDPVENLRMIARARRISPRDPRSHRWLHYAGWCHWKMGDFDRMEAAARSAISLYSDSPAQWVELTCALGLQGKHAEARAAGKVLKRLSPAFTADRFYEIARIFYGARFAGSVQREYRALCTTLGRAL